MLSLIDVCSRPIGRLVPAQHVSPGGIPDLRVHALVKHQQYVVVDTPKIAQILVGMIVEHVHERVRIALHTMPSSPCALSDDPIVPAGADKPEPIATGRLVVSILVQDELHLQPRAVCDSAWDATFEDGAYRIAVGVGLRIGWVESRGSSSVLVIEEQQQNRSDSEYRCDCKHDR
jgi:hypothetical protein